MEYSIIKNLFNKDRFFSLQKPGLKKFKNSQFESSLLIENLNTNNCGGLRYKNLYKKSYKNFPLISVIVPNLNGNKLKQTLDSILIQDYPNIEIILIDGGSHEKNISFIKKNYNDNIDIWISRKDYGIYDGWNQGIRLANGDYIGIINSNDFYYKNAFRYLIRYINLYPTYDFILGAVEKKKVHAGFRPDEINLRFNIYPSTVIGFFIKLEAQKKVGLYNIKYKCSSDYDMFYRIIKKHKLKGIPTTAKEVFGKFELGGYSSKLSFFEHLREEIKIRYHNKQNLFILLYIILGRCSVKFLNKLKIVINTFY